MKSGAQTSVSAISKGGDNHILDRTPRCRVSRDRGEGHSVREGPTMCRGELKEGTGKEGVKVIRVPTSVRALSEVRNIPR